MNAAIHQGLWVGHGRTKSTAAGATKGVVMVLVAAVAGALIALSAGCQAGVPVARGRLEPIDEVVRAAEELAANERRWIDSVMLNQEPLG